MRHVAELLLSLLLLLLLLLLVLSSLLLLLVFLVSELYVCMDFYFYFILGFKLILFRIYVNTVDEGEKARGEIFFSFGYI